MEILQSVKKMSLPNLLIGIFLLAIISITIVTVVYFYNFHGSLSREQAVWGTFGDFIGGVLNPALSFIGLIALLSTLYFQSEELKISRRDAIESRQELSRSAEAQEKLGQQQLQQVKIQRLTARISVIKLLLSYDDTSLVERSSQSASFSTIRVSDYTGSSKKELLDELGEIYATLKKFKIEETNNGEIY